MKTRVLGRTGLNVSEIGFGAWGIGSKHYGPVEENQAMEALGAYVEAGGNFIDTARGYQDSEKVIGKFLAEGKLRDRVVICTKIGPHDPAAIRRDLETSLTKLQTDHVEVLYIHNPPDSPETMNQLLDLFERFRSEGKTRFVGASIQGGNVTDHTIDIHHQYIDTGRVDVIQLIFSILRQKNAAIFDKARKSGVGLVGRTVLESGFLTAKYPPGHRFPGKFPDGDQRTRWNVEQLDKILTVAQELKAQLVQPPYTNLAQVAMRFALDQPEISTIIPGQKSAEQARANVAVAELPPLSPALRQIITRYAGNETLVNP
jgi:aryl-alcohol dehydrogenase-like predicted oxidoreductase